MNLCPNCGNAEIEKVKENVYYCKQCDETYSREKGKPVVKPSEKKSLLEAMAEKIKEHDEKLEKITSTKKQNEGFFDFLYD